MMQERIIEIIVHLLIELQQERNQIEKVDLTRSLLAKKYTDGEINLAFSWIFDYLKNPPQDRIDSDSEYSDQLDEFPEFEKLVISSEAYGFLLQLIQLGVIKENDIEVFVERAVAFGKDDLSVDDMKSIIATILFGLDSRSSFNGYPQYQGDIPLQ